MEYQVPNNRSYQIFLDLQAQLTALMGLVVDYELTNGVRMVTLGNCPTVLVSYFVFNPGLPNLKRVNIVEQDHGEDGQSYTAEFEIDGQKYNITSFLHPEDSQCED